MANQHIFNNTLIITGSVTASQGFYGDGSGLTGITAVAEWDGSRNGDASITGSLVVSGSSVNVDFVNTTGVSGSFSGSFEGSHSGNGSGLTNLNLNGYQASGSNLSGSFSGSYIGDGSGLTNLNIFPYNGDATITGSLTVSGSNVTIDFTDTSAISGSSFSGSFIGDGSGLTNLGSSEWNGRRNGDAEITGSFIVSGSSPTIELLGDTTIDQNIEISNRNQLQDLAIGYQALPDSTIDRGTIALGYQAGLNQTSGSSNILIGQSAGCSGIKTENNIAIGNYALRNNTGQDLGSPSTRASNIAIGTQAAILLTTGYENTIIGTCAAYNSTTMGQSTIIGSEAGLYSNGGSNVLIGHEAGRCASSLNVIIGLQAAWSNQGSRNALVGYQSGLSLGSGTKNTAIGFRSGYLASGNSTRNVYIGNEAGPSTGTTESDQLYVGIKGGGSNALIRGDFSTGQLTINSQVSASIFSGSFVGDGSGLTGVSGDGFPYNGAAVITGSLFVSQSTATGTAVTIENGHTILSQVSESLNFDSDSAAAIGGVPLGGLYRSGNFIAIRLT